ncbi:hypothetical protein L3X38_031481 [Prunus dulcis]|uniref:Reverse transcriptase Ty1/copia-type domain-containing protein n=1 Tax=Prunus dulcis TaxID=3755 RepID=A0AAD4VC66_PRUDU|nr:hypothetical protein L3X38_031481 [Prunus dulcis]
MNVEVKAVQKYRTWEIVQQPDGTIDRYKARLVAKGYMQPYRVDYQDAFAPMVKMNTVPVLLSSITNLDCLLKQFDVKNAFLHGDLEEEVYVDLPTGYELSKNGGVKYVLNLLIETGMLGCAPVETPIMHNHHLAIYPDQVPTNKGSYKRLVRKLIYLSHTRPDIAYAVSVVSQFMHSPSEDHLVAVMRILSYLKKALGNGLILRKLEHLDVKGYTDADWPGNIIDRRSISRYFTFIGDLIPTALALFADRLLSPQVDF